MVGNHRDGIIEAYHLVDTLDRLRLAVVNVGEFAAEDWAGGNRGNLHAGNLDVDAELRLAVDFVGRVEAFGRGADEREVLGVLKCDVIRHR